MHFMTLLSINSSNWSIEHYVILQCNWIHVIIRQITQEDLIGNLLSGCFDLTEMWIFLPHFIKERTTTYMYVPSFTWKIFPQINLPCNCLQFQLVPQNVFKNTVRAKLLNLILLEKYYVKSVKYSVLFDNGLLVQNRDNNHGWIYTEKLCTSFKPKNR